MLCSQVHEHLEARKLLEQSHARFHHYGYDAATRTFSGLSIVWRPFSVYNLVEMAKAERLLQRWFDRHMKLRLESVTLTPKAVSLNSFNGFYQMHGKAYFFKTHVEEQGTLEEYYHAELLHQAGYNIVKPLQTLHEGGRQMVIYPVVHWPVMFDLVRSIELGFTEDDAFAQVITAEKQECARLIALYAKTSVHSSEEEHARAPIHQLFWHRLAGERFKNFYLGKVVPLPDQQSNSTTSWDTF